MFYHHLLGSGPEQFPEVKVELLYIEKVDEDEMANIHVPDTDAPTINIIHSSNGSLSTVIDVDRSTSKSRPVGMRLQIRRRTCWRGPLLAHGNYESSLFYFCVYMKDTVCSSLCRSELLNSSSFLKIYKCSSCPIIYHENRQCCLFQLHMRQ